MSAARAYLLGSLPAGVHCWRPEEDRMLAAPKESIDAVAVKQLVKRVGAEQVKQRIAYLQAETMA